MIETLGVLAIIGLLSVGAISGYSVAMERYKVQRTVDNMQVMALRALRLFETLPKKSRTYYIKDLKKMGIVPDDYKKAKVSGNKINTMLDGSLEISINESLEDFSGQFLDGGRFTIKAPKVSIAFKFYDLSRSQCMRLLMLDWRNFPDFFTIANSTDNNNSNRTREPLSPEQAADLCKESRSTGKIAVSIYSNFLYRARVDR